VVSAAIQRIEVAMPTPNLRPAVALTLVEMGQNLIQMETAFDLEGGVAKVQRAMATRGGHRDEPPEV
jgi:rsbT antagonist protein RsbS